MAGPNKISKVWTIYFCTMKLQCFVCDIYKIAIIKPQHHRQIILASFLLSLVKKHFKLFMNKGVWGVVGGMTED